MNRSTTAEELIETSEKMDFEKFMAMKKTFLMNLEMVWLIQGHLTEEDALKMVNETESALTFKRINENDIAHSRCVRLKDRTVYYIEKENPLATNPNSVCCAVFQDNVETDKVETAASNIMMGLLKEPVYNQLRTRE